MQTARSKLPVVLFFLLFSASSHAQYVFRSPTPTPTPTPSQKPPPQIAPEPRAGQCPVVSVQAQPPGPIRDGQRIYFSANIAGGDPRVVPNILWSTLGGSVMSGQNSRRIEVDSTGAGSAPERDVRADLWVGGYAGNCVLQASASVKVIPPPVKFGEFGEVATETLTKNIKTLASFLSQSPDSVYLIAYAGRSSERGFVANWVKRIRDGLIEEGVSSRRIMVMDGGFREEPLFDFWIVPIGSIPPRPEPTVRRNEIVYPPRAPVKKP